MLVLESLSCHAQKAKLNYYLSEGKDHCKGFISYAAKSLSAIEGSKPCLKMFQSATLTRKEILNSLHEIPSHL